MTIREAVRLFKRIGCDIWQGIYRSYTFQKIKKVSVRATNNDDEPGINYLTIEPIL